MSPIAVGASRQFLPPLDEQHASVADLALPRRGQLEALQEVFLVLLAVGESRTEWTRKQCEPISSSLPNSPAGLGFADAAAGGGPVNFRPVEGKHDDAGDDERKVILAVTF